MTETSEATADAATGSDTSTADWQLAVPTRRVEADGTAHVVATLVDPTSGEEGTVTVQLTADRRLTCTVTGIALADFQAWSDR